MGNSLSWEDVEMCAEALRSLWGVDRAQPRGHITIDAAPEIAEYLAYARETPSR